MELREYIKPLSASEKEAFAVCVGTTLGHLLNVAYEQRKASAALAAQIEIETKGSVPVATLRPRDWHLIWDPRRNQMIVPGAIVGQNGVASNDALIDSPKVA